MLDAVSSMVKPPRYGYRFCCGHGYLHHHGEKLALKRHHRLFTHRLPYDCLDLTLSGGAGVAALSTARAAADRPLRPPRC
jgi:hypothetical protein